MPTDQFETLAARADLARLLAACFYEPVPELAEERVFESMAAAAASIDPSLVELTRSLGEAFEADVPTELLVDYTRLFLGPSGALAQPYGSVWLEDGSSVMRDSTLTVSALYAQGGFELAEDFRDLPDHIAAELEFLYLLLFRRAEAFRNDDDRAAQIYGELQWRFFNEHLGRWAPRFTQAMHEGAQTAFYRELATLVGAFVRSEADAIDRR